MKNKNIKFVFRFQDKINKQHFIIPVKKSNSLLGYCFFFILTK